MGMIGGKQLEGLIKGAIDTGVTVLLYEQITLGKFEVASLLVNGRSNTDNLTQRMADQLLCEKKPLMDNLIGISIKKPGFASGGSSKSKFGPDSPMWIHGNHGLHTKFRNKLNFTKLNIDRIVKISIINAFKK